MARTPPHADTEAGVGWRSCIWGPSKAEMVVLGGWWSGHGYVVVVVVRCRILDGGRKASGEVAKVLE